MDFLTIATARVIVLVHIPHFMNTNSRSTHLPHTQNTSSPASITRPFSTKTNLQPPDDVRTTHARRTTADRGTRNAAEEDTCLTISSHQPIASFEICHLSATSCRALKGGKHLKKRSPTTRVQYRRSPMSHPVAFFVFCFVPSLTLVRDFYSLRILD